MDIEEDVFVDAKGLRCPEPLMLVRNKMMDMSSGQVIKVEATDPSTSWDFRNFCKMNVVAVSNFKRKIFKFDIY